MRNLTEKERKTFNIAINNVPFLKNGYWYVQTSRRRFKVSRLTVMLHMDKYLEIWELVHHKDGNSQNDTLDNLEVLNHSEHNALHYNPDNQSKPDGWKPANTTPPEVIERIREVASGMVKINCSEIARILKKEKISINSVTVKRYL